MVETNYQADNFLKETENRSKVTETMMIKEYPQETDVGVKQEENTELNWIEVEEEISTEVLEDKEHLKISFSNKSNDENSSMMEEDDKSVRMFADMTCDVCRKKKFRK